MIAASDTATVRSVMQSAGFTHFSEAENVLFFNHPEIPFRVDFLPAEQSAYHSRKLPFPKDRGREHQGAVSALIEDESLVRKYDNEYRYNQNKDRPFCVD